MPYSVIVSLDEVLSASIGRMWATLAGNGIASERAVPGNHPHVTLGVYHDETKSKAAGKTIRGMAVARDAIPIVLAGYGIFPGDRCTLWAVPTVTQALLTLHRELHAAVPSDDPYYAPDRWVPHITLARDLTPRAAAAGLEALSPIWQERHGFLVRIELITFVPVVVLEDYPLPQRS